MKYLRLLSMAGLFHAGGPIWVKPDSVLRFRSTDRG